MKTIRAKIRLIICMSVAGAVLLSAFNMIASNTQNDVRSQEKILNKAVGQSKDVKYEMATTRKFERQYLKNPQIASSKIVSQSINKVQYEAASLKEDYKSNPNISKQFKVIEESAKAYSKSYAKLISTYEMIGYNDSEGISGQITQFGDGMEKALSKTKNKSLEDQFLFIRMYEKQYRKTNDQGAFSEYNTRVSDLQNSLNSSSLSAAVKKSLAQSLQNYTNAMSSLVAGYLKSKELSVSFDSTGQEIENAAAELETIVSKEQAILDQKMQDKTKSFAFASLVISILVIITLITVGIVLLRTIQSSIAALKTGAEKIGSGNLNHRVIMKRKDEMVALAATFNRMAEMVRNSLTGVRSSADKLNASSQHLAAISEETSAQSNQVNVSIKQVAAGATHQSAELEESNAIMKSVSSSIQQTEQVSREIAAEAEETEKEGQEGLSTVESLQETSEQFLGLANHLTVQIQSASEKSRSISGIVGTIQEIAENTDLLALNAAIESARAGDAGRGFGVVAKEVRKLAERSKKEAQSIQDLIQTMNKQMDKLMSEAQKFNEYKTVQSNSVAYTKQAFEKIVEHVTRISSKISNVQQSINLVQSSNHTLAEKMAEIYLISEQSAGASQEVSASSESQLLAIHQVNEAASELSFIASDLQSVVSQFDLDGTGDAPDNKKSKKTKKSKMKKPLFKKPAFFKRKQKGKAPAGKKIS
ncbi:methyl-accepting chemotaxis protein [Bacillus sp. OV322]|uniref:methyl-accepting chemotaxis protein n=1 Tax=Bacillus sp. OV322 TaxID=1882764 RepID=UPI0008F26938|nr:methyl-accepting chemotaxis protein [Bacillus sp. OV322]SFC58489.1 methyl-accepting chemotaxis protein [Bacillus sp. OV322]